MVSSKVTTSTSQTPFQRHNSFPLHTLLVLHYVAHIALQYSKIKPLLMDQTAPFKAGTLIQNQNKATKIGIWKVQKLNLVSKGAQRVICKQAPFCEEDHYKQTTPTSQLLPMRQMHILNKVCGQCLQFSFQFFSHRTWLGNKTYLRYYAKKKVYKCKTNIELVPRYPYYK